MCVYLCAREQGFRIFNRGCHGATPDEKSIPLIMIIYNISRGNRLRELYYIIHVLLYYTYSRVSRPSRAILLVLLVVRVQRCTKINHRRQYYNSYIISNIIQSSIDCPAINAWRVFTALDARNRTIGVATVMAQV